MDSMDSIFKIDLLIKIFGKFYEYKIMNLLLCYSAHILYIIPEFYQKKNLKSSSKETSTTSYWPMRYIFYDTKKLNSFFSLKDIFLIILTCLIDLFVEFFYIYLDDRLYDLYEKENKSKDEGEEIYNDEIYFVQFIFLSFFSYFFSFQKFYKHHYFSLACIIIFEIIRFIAFGYQSKFLNFLLNIIRLLGKSYNMVFFKSLMENKYISVYNCCYLLGIINAPILLLLYLILSFIPCDNKIFCNNEFKHADSFIEFFKNFDILIFLGFIINAIVNSLYTLLINQTIYKYSVFHVTILFQIIDIISCIISNNSKNYLNIIFFVFEVIFNCVFLEIIILHFWDLILYY